MRLAFSLECTRYNRVIAGIYSLKEWIEQQACKTGATVEKITDKVTQTCNHCGNITEQRVGSAQYFSCEHCQIELEIDVNAATNCLRLASGEVMKQDTSTKIGRYQRAKLTKNVSSRKDGSDSALEA